VAQLSAKLRSVEVSDGNAVSFWCPGCDHAHVLRVRPDTSGRPAWDWDGNADSPTFAPSILVRVEWSKSLEPGDDPAEWQDAVCHSFVRAGMIQFLTDSTHALAGRTVPLPDWPAAVEGMVRPGGDRR